jgi:hypothetical protein
VLAVRHGGTYYILKINSNLLRKCRGKARKSLEAEINFARSRRMAISKMQIVSSRFPLGGNWATIVIRDGDGGKSRGERRTIETSSSHLQRNVEEKPLLWKDRRETGRFA